MKKLLITLCALFMCAASHAQTETINWYKDDEIYATTQCESGGNIVLPNTPLKRGYTFKGWWAYTPVEYIESTGTQWIDTGFIANNGMILDAKVKPVKGELRISSISPQSINPDFTRNSFRYGNGEYAFSKLEDYRNYYAYPDTDPVIVYLDTTGYRFYATINEYIIVNKNSSSALENQTETVKISYSDYEPKIFSGRYYYVKLYDSTRNLVRDFVPALDKNGVACMFDRVSGTFFYNQGTGDFIAGPIVAEE